jgi:hypothetical protein
VIVFGCMQLARPMRRLALPAVLAAALALSGAAACEAPKANDVPAVLLAAFLDTRPFLSAGRRLVIDPYRLGADTMRHLWVRRDLGRILADTLVTLGDPTVRGFTLEGRPLPWRPGVGEVGVSFSVPEVRGDTASVLVYVGGGPGKGYSHALDRLTLVRRRGTWTVIRREPLMIS